MIAALAMDHREISRKFTRNRDSLKMLNRFLTTSHDNVITELNTNDYETTRHSFVYHQ